MSETSGITLLQDSTNYPFWKCEIEAHLEGSALLYTICESSTATENKNWKRDDAKTRKIVLTTVCQNLKIHLLSCTSAKEMFEVLDKTLNRDTAQNKNSLIGQFHAYKFDSSKSIIDNAMALQNLAFRLKQVNEPISDNLIISKILSILPQHLRFFATAWESTSQADRTISNLIARLQDEQSAPTEEPNSTAFLANRKGSSCYRCGKLGHIARNCKPLFCTFCKKSNHTVEKCFLKQKRNFSNVPNGQCHICKKDNHVAENCFFRATKPDSVEF